MTASAKWRPQAAMVLGGGLGKRMLPLTKDIPKPMVRLKGRTLIDHVLDRIAAAGVARAVVNVHYCADKLEVHLKQRKQPEIRISDERQQLLDTGGGVTKALPLLGPEPFLIHNSDSVWIEGVGSNLERLFAAWDPDNMDSLMLLASAATSLGYEGSGDFAMDKDGRLVAARRAPDGPVRIHRRIDRASADVRRCTARTVLDQPPVGHGDRQRTTVRHPPRWPVDACRNAGSLDRGGKVDRE